MSKNQDNSECICSEDLRPVTSDAQDAKEAMSDVSEIRWACGSWTLIMNNKEKMDETLTVVSRKLWV